MENPADAPSDPVVLVVEDEPLVRTLAAEVLMDVGYRVFEACEAADALTILEGRRDIRMVFTDIEMPGMTGLALAQTIDERWPDTAILLTSGRIRPDPAALPVGAGFIAKPWRAEELVASIGEVIERRRGGAHG